MKPKILVTTILFLLSCSVFAQGKNPTYECPVEMINTDGNDNSWKPAGKLAEKIYVIEPRDSSDLLVSMTKDGKVIMPPELLTGKQPVNNGKAYGWRLNKGGISYAIFMALDKKSYRFMMTNPKTSEMAVFQGSCVRL